MGTKAADLLWVFVYGTLKPGEANYEFYCASDVVDAKKAWVRGQLYSLPQGYPAMTTGDGWVKGYLFTLDETAMVGLDYLEGYTPDGCENLHSDNDFEEEYTRQRTTVFDLTGQPMGEAWVYVMGQPPDGAVFLPEGNWALSRV